MSKEAYKALESVVGTENISADPIICESYTQVCFWKDMPSIEAGIERPVCVVLPRTTDEVQRIVRIANRYKLSFNPASTYYDTHCIPKKPDTILIDLKRMNRFEIDEKNLFAIVESNVTVSQLQAELMDRGLYTMTPGGGAQASVLCNTLGAGMGPIMYKTGLAQRRMLALEWVMPDGELLKTGSASSLKDYFWGEGPGPDLRGLVRGFIGWSGGLGIVTKMAVKVYPFIPERPQPIGISPDTGLELPTKWLKWFNIIYPSLEDLVEVMYEIPKAWIGASIMRVPVIWRYRARTKSKQEFWEIWEKAGDELKKSFPWIM
ncbi:MAG: FAD-binding oxidoreductase, partial [bacterium]|nr:FAD-binding oxidoreductase [bacterium]